LIDLVLQIDKGFEMGFEMEVVFEDLSSAVGKENPKKPLKNAFLR
jgi:hypothetical protein